MTGCIRRTMVCCVALLASCLVVEPAGAEPPKWEQIQSLELPAGPTLRDLLLVSDTEMYIGIYTSSPLG